MAKQTGTINDAVSEYLESRYPGLTSDTIGYTVQRHRDGSFTLSIDLITYPGLFGAGENKE